MLTGKVEIVLDLEKIYQGLDDDNDKIDVIVWSYVEALYYGIFCWLVGVLDAEYGIHEDQLSLKCDTVGRLDLNFPMVSIQLALNNDQQIMYSKPPGEHDHSGPDERLVRVIKAIESYVRIYLHEYLRGPIWSIGVGITYGPGIYYQTHDSDLVIPKLSS